MSSVDTITETYDAARRPLHPGDTVVALNNYLETRNVETETIGRVLSIEGTADGFFTYTNVSVQFPLRAVTVLSDDLLVIHDPNIEALVAEYPWQVES